MNIPFESDLILENMKNLWLGKIPHEDDFYFFRLICNNHQNHQPITLLDCGANSGQSAISFLMNCPKGYVISFEPNLIYKPVLEGVRQLLGNERFEFHMEGLADQECDLDLYIPYVDGIPYLQEASLELSQFEKAWVLDRLKSYGEKLEIIPLCAHFAVADEKKLKVDVVKIDAEGAELRVLQGMRDIILEHSPIFLIENNDWKFVTDFLSVYGYEPYQWLSGRIVKMKEASTNCFYLQEEHIHNYGLLI